MKPVILAFAAAAALATSACTQPTPSAPRDTGNMAFPTPLPQGNVGTSMGTRPADTGNMAFPASPGIVGNTNTPTSRGADTNGAQYQPNLPQGQLGTTRTTR